MPNHIKNRIELIGSSSAITALIDRFSTYFERTPKKADDGRLIYDLPNTHKFGWYDENENIFEYGHGDERGNKVQGIPDGYEQYFDEAWVRFPDFEKIIPMPEELRITSSTRGEIALYLLFGHSEKFDFLSIPEKQERMKQMDDTTIMEEIETAIRYFNNIKKYGFKTWYDWSIKNWGTKWNAYSCNKISENIFQFETAWSGVPELIEKISKEFPEVAIMYKYSDEDTGSNCGIGEFKNGEISFRELENRSKEAYELAFELRPDYKENYKLVDDKYEYVEES